MTAPIDYRQLIGKNIILYGESGTGKTTIMLDILYALKEEVAACIIFSPSEQQNGTYTGIIPDLMINSNPDMTSEYLKNKLQQLLKRQDKISSDYRTANDFNLLQQTYQMMETSQNQQEVAQLQKMMEKIEKNIKQVDEDQALETDRYQKMNLVKQFERTYKDCESKLLNIYRAEIHENKKKYIKGKFGPITNNQLILVNNIYLNPNLILILDDCGSILDMTLQKDQCMKKLFFAGRHCHITLMLAVQSETTVCTQFRGGAFYSFFCSSRILLRFGKAENGLDFKTARQLAEKMNANKQENERVLFDKHNNKCYSFVPIPRSKFKFGSKLLWEYVEFLQK